MNKRQVHLGFSLIEALICLMILAVIAAIAAPALQQALQRQRLHLAAQALYIDLQQARSLALQGARNIYLRVHQDELGACYVIHAGNAASDCSCNGTGTAQCKPDVAAIKTQGFPSKTNSPAFQANVNGMVFAGRQGTVSSTGSLDLSQAQAGKVRHVVSIMGRVRSCSPDGSVPNLARCV